MSGTPAPPAAGGRRRQLARAERCSRAPCAARAPPRNMAAFAPQDTVAREMILRLRLPVVERSGRLRLRSPRRSFSPGARARDVPRRSLLVRPQRRVHGPYAHRPPGRIRVRGGNHLLLSCGNAGPDRWRGGRARFHRAAEPRRVVGTAARVPRIRGRDPRHERSARERYRELLFGAHPVGDAEKFSRYVADP